MKNNATTNFADLRRALVAVLDLAPDLDPERRAAVLRAFDGEAPPDAAPELLSMQEASRRSGKPTMTLYRWIRSGRLRVRRVAGRLVIDADSLADATNPAPLPPGPSA